MRYTRFFPCSRFPIPVPLLGGVRGGFRFPIPDSRFPIPDSRFPIPYFKNAISNRKITINK
ncbi:MAG: hypothetical protein F6J94_08105 [Moorea sp. SIO1F2]|uniref:hypothetical protein n=1 Tax=Moorena sp. SIO1F2 TaxID=2607819 RepID=UPI0013BCB08E|nr:hypothetical protein [Moorena sp. SIO1F2]NET81905.1 hypothetical protein [Moorena sp. SIO1F2]